MTERQKAEALVADFQTVIEQSGYQSSTEIHYFTAKRCAMIAAKEMTNLAATMSDKCKEPDLKDELYWQKVWIELELMR